MSKIREAGVWSVPSRGRGTTEEVCFLRLFLFLSAIYSGPNPDLIQMIQQIAWVLINPVSTGAL